MLVKEKQEIIQEWKKGKGNIRLFTPNKYFVGLDTKKLIIMKLDEMLKFKNESDYTKIVFKSDQAIPKQTKGKAKARSKYMKILEERFSIKEGFSLSQKSEVTGVPLEILNQIYKRGMSAWKSGHFPGTTPSQWGNSRVNSFLVLGCTALSADSDKLEQVYELKLKLEKQKAKKKLLQKLQFFFDQKENCSKQKIANYMKKNRYPSFLMD